MRAENADLRLVFVSDMACNLGLLVRYFAGMGGKKFEYFVVCGLSLISEK
jgi:hypothetical protein